MLLAERHLISREHALGEGARGVAIAYDETLSIMVNEEDHLRIQVLRSGMLFNEAYEEADITDSILGSSLNYAFSPQFGFLTACPTNVGTGLRVSVLVHLPALALVKQMEKVFQSLSHINYTMRGLFGEGTLPIGNFYQISNQISLGKSELDIINEMKSVIPQIVQYERVWRQKLLDEEKGQIEDRIWRANGILRNAHIITSEETMELLSALRLGINLGLIEDIDMNTLNELFMSTQPSHLQKMEGRVLEPEERDTMRASFIREKLISNAR
jgi:protein arginine kinase